MTSGFDLPKGSPEAVARAIFDGVEADEDDLFPDPMSESVADSWRSGSSKTLERVYAAFVPAQPLAAERNEQNDRSHDRKT